MVKILFSTPKQYFLHFLSYLFAVENISYVNYIFEAHITQQIEDAQRV